MELNQKIKLHNRYDIEVKNVKSGEIRQRAQAENIILDGAWAQILNNTRGAWFNAIAYGTGTGTMSAARTSLFSQIGSKVATDSEYFLDNDNNYVSHRQKIVILENEHVGAQLSEVGIMSSRTGTPLMTHAMIKDMNGNPVVITKTDTDIITIYATIYLLFNTTYSPAAVLDICRCNPVNNGLIRTLLGRTIAPGDPVQSGFNFIFSAVQGTENIGIGGDAYTSAVQVAILDVPNKRIRFYYRIPAADANVGGFKTGVIHGTENSKITDYPSIIMRFTPGGISQAQVIEQIGTGDGNTKDFATSFAHIPSNTVVKVDGTPVSTTIMADMPNQPIINGFFKKVPENEAYKNEKVDFGVKMVGEFIIENTSTHPVTSIVASWLIVSASSDGVTWVDNVFQFSGVGIKLVPEQYQTFKYWKLTATAGSGDHYILSIYSDGFANYKNIRFSTAPASGAVITAEYTPLCAAKDANHVLDIDITIQLAEQVE